MATCAPSHPPPTRPSSRPRAHAAKRGPRRAQNNTEVVLTDGARSFGAGVRNIGAESLFEYGSRVGFWRIMKMLEERQLPCTMYACAVAFEMLPKSAAYIREHADRIDVCCHGWRWWPQHNMAEEVEREHIRLAVESLRRTVGVTDTQHLGWYGRYAPSVNSRRLLHEAGFRYDSDSYCDDMPYWDTVGGEPHLVIPYSIQNNDAHLTRGPPPEPERAPLPEASALPVCMAGTARCPAWPTPSSRASRTRSTRCSRRGARARPR